jgi:UDP-glucose 4-epimerase
MRAIVTGGAGFIGSHVVDALLERGDEVHVLDDLSTGKRERVAEGARLHVADIRAPDEVFDTVRPDVVLHLAAQVDVQASVERPDHDADVNVLGTLRVLEAARRHGAKIVFSSSGGAVYGECDGPVSETADRRPLAPYGASKLCGEEYLATWNRLHGTSHTTIRPANVYGPRQEPRGEAGVIAVFMTVLADGGTPTIYGNGSQTRDYVYVADVARAMLAALEVDGGVFNVGTGVETSLLDLYDAIVRVTGNEGKPKLAPPRLGDIKRNVLDVSLAERELGWRPQQPLDAGLAETWRWVTS